MRKSTFVPCALAALWVPTLAAPSAAASPFATSVVSYDPGSNPTGLFTDPGTAIGSPERFTGEGVFPSGVTPFNPAFGTDEIVSVGAGGQLTLGFDRAITDDPSHPFGVDFIVFGNAAFSDVSFFDADPDNNGAGITGSDPSLFGVGGDATIQVSRDAVTWTTVAVRALDLFPTLGYQDTLEPTPPTPGLVETDFTKALDPSLTLADFANLDIAQIAALYGGSGGGIGIDISGTGLASASFVRFVNGSGTAFELDAVSVVPAPGALGIATVAVGALLRRRRA